MPKKSDELDVNDRVVTLVDLPGVPKGTKGRIILRNGFEWIRYRVWFDTGTPNGVDVGSLDAKVLDRI
ncbi:MAG: hypothetical protein R2698_10395 [Microthrixaceae bacterium]